MKIEETILPNGIKVIGIPRKNSESVAIHIGFKTGSRSEEEDVAGISHFLEHMFFKGSKKRPDAKTLSRDFDRIGAQVNAATSKEWTYYHIKTTPENFDIALDIIGDMITAPVLDEKELNKEKGTIIQELQMTHDNPMNDVFNKIEEVVYGKKTPMGREIIGYEKTIRATNREKMVSYLHKHYNAENCGCVVAGDIPKDYIEKLSSYLLKLPKGEKTEWIKPSFSPKKLSVNFKETDQTVLGMALPGVSVKDDDRFKLEVASTILAGYMMMSSRLFTEIREKRGWAYRIWGYNDNNSDSGYLGIYGGIKTNKIVDAIKIIKDQIVNFAETVTDEEIERAKGNLIGSVPLKFEDNDELASYVLLSYLTSGKIGLPHDEVEEIKKVTKADVIEIAKKYFNGRELYLTVIGPFKDSEKFVKILGE